jgi:hypothetical protein
MSAEPGQIYTYVMRSERGKREWFVGELPDHEVPDEIWVALAKWRLSQ